MPYDIYVLDETDLTITGGQLDGVTQGDGSHLDGLTITLNNNNWQQISINDNDPNFQDNDSSQTLVNSLTLDGGSYAAGTIVEAEYSFEVTDGTNTWTVIGFNARGSGTSYATVEGIAFVEGPGGFPPVGVALTISNPGEGPSFAASDYSTPICFAAGTMIETETGPRAVEDIAVGEYVLTANDGFQPVRWVACRTFQAQGDCAPIVFAAGAIGNSRELVVSPQHRIEVSDWRAQLMCGEDAVLIPAKAFLGEKGVTRRTGGTVTYCHLMFDRHQIVYAEGVASESFHPGEVGLSGIAAPAHRELMMLFPELATDVAAYGPAALPDVRGAEAIVLLAA